MKSNMSSNAMLLALLSMVSAQCINSEAPDAAEGAFFASVTAVESNLDVLNSLVQGWSKDDGLMGALAIQESYYPLYDAVTNLNSEAANLTPVESKNVVNYVKTMDSLVADISTLIGSLNDKANDLTSVGAGSIVAGDITSLASPASEIESHLFANLPTDAPCVQVASASVVASNLEAAFSGAAVTFSISEGIPEFPAAPTACSSYCGESAAASSAAGSSAAGSSAAGSSAAASSAAGSSAAGSSAAASAAASSAAAETSAGAASSAAPEGPCVTSAAANPINPTFGSSVEAVIEPLTSLNSLVEKWSSADGLQGALAIQEGYQPLYDAVMGLQEAVGDIESIEANDAISYVQTLNTLVSDISTLLGSLNDKAQDFTKVGAAQIVQGDISSLAAPASEIAASIFGYMPTDVPCPVASSAAEVGNSLGDAFSGAAETFSITGVPEFPAAPTVCLNYCGGETGVPTAPAASSTPAGNSSAAAVSSGAAASSGAAGNGTTSAPAGNSTTSGAAEGTVTTVVTAFTTYCPEPTTLCPGNGKCYTVTEATTLTVTDCPCTIPKEEATTFKVTAATTLTKTSGPKATAPLATVPASEGTAVAPANGASSLAAGFYAAVAGVAAFALL